MKELSHKEIQMAELEILLQFDKICRENGFRYSLAGGTLLGAVRHKGFIPWDDDIDVMMPRPDYEKFIEWCKTAPSDRFRYFTNADKCSQYPFIKILDNEIQVVRDGLADVSNLWIDIFPVDGLPADETKLNKIYKKNRFYIRIISFSMWRSLKAYHGRHSKFKALLIFLFVKLYGYRRAKRKLEKLAVKYPYGSTEFMGCIVWGMYGSGERMPLSGFESCIDVEFEGYSLKAVSCWHEYLSGIYGDYMQLPPEEDRKTHEIKAYRIEEKTNE